MPTTYTPATGTPPVASYELPNDGEGVSFASLMTAIIEPLADGIAYLAANIGAAALLKPYTWTGVIFHLFSVLTVAKPSSCTFNGDRPYGRRVKAALQWDVRTNISDSEPLFTITSRSHVEKLNFDAVREHAGLCIKDLDGFACSSLNGVFHF